MTVNTTLQDNCRNMRNHLPDNSIDCIVTSPPYWGLRSYGDETTDVWDGDESCEHEWEEIVKPGGSAATRASQTSNFCQKCNAWRGQLGLEPTFQLYIQHLIQIFNECFRVLKPTGTCWVNLGDSYAGSGKAGNNPEYQARHTEFGKPSEHKQRFGMPTKEQLGAPAKSLCQIPSRFAIAMTDAGWILRNEIIWWKRNCMPSSATDRFTVDFEKIFFFTKSKKYFFEQQFDIATGFDGRKDTFYKGGDKDMAGGAHERWANKTESGELGRNKRTVWDIPTRPLADAHYAAYPEDLVAIMLRSGCPEQVCSQCGTPRQKVYKNGKDIPKKGGASIKYADSGLGLSPTSTLLLTKTVKEKIETGLTDCGCNEPFHPGVVMDPFGGSGTTGLVARKLHMNYVMFEMVSKYIHIKNKRHRKHLGLFT